MKYIVIFVSVFLFSCNNKQQNQPKNFNEKIVDFAIENSNDKFIELPNLYDSLSKNIVNDNTEKLILVQTLKNKSFKVINWGRGNHPLGSRIVSITLKKDSCECEVDKIYYSSIDSIDNVSERIKCYKVLDKSKGLQQN
ncbi:hypothetical protein [Flavobacterium sp.]|uniref:hypothetical protein n=1 Tax=Flavobacterium sp. TaxID=239 RepID=UPI00286D82F5|nr:hypothetical protein [Flavobacterium sp.]